MGKEYCYDEDGDTKQAKQCTGGTIASVEYDEEYEKMI